MKWISDHWRQSDMGLFQVVYDADEQAFEVLVAGDFPEDLRQSMLAALNAWIELVFKKDVNAPIVRNSRLDK